MTVRILDFEAFRQSGFSVCLGLVLFGLYLLWSWSWGCTMLEWLKIQPLKRSKIDYSGWKVISLD